MSLFYITKKKINEFVTLETKEILDYCPCGCGNPRVFLENTLVFKKEFSIINSAEQITIKGIIINPFYINPENISKGEIGKVTKIESIDDLKNIMKKENE